MKSSKKALAFALAAAMVVTAFPVTNAEAASTAKLSTTKVTVAAGTAKKQTKSIKVTTPSTWKSVKVKVSSSDKKIATVKASGKTVKVTAVKKGSAKVTVKVTAKKGKKAVSKTLKANVKVINAGLKLTNAPAEVVVGSETKLTAKKCPQAAKVTFSSSDETIATVTDGTLKALKAGKVTITATSDYGKTVTTDITVKEIVVESAAQTKLNQVVLTYQGDASKITKDDVVITRTSDNQRIYTKAVANNATDKKLTVDTLINMTDSKEFTVAVKDSTAKFTATDGKTVSLGLTKTEIVYNTATKVGIKELDANGVELKTVECEGVANTKDNIEYKIDVTSDKGYATADGLVLNKVGDTAKVTATKHTGVYKDGKEDGNITFTGTITAVDSTAMAAGEKWTIASSDVEPYNWSKVTENHDLVVGEIGYLFMNVKDTKGDDIVKGDPTAKGYKIVSMNKDVLFVDEANKNELVPNKPGQAVININDKNDKTIWTYAITVKEAAKPTSFALSEGSVTISNASSAAVKADIEVTVKDQYGRKIDGALKVTRTAKPADFNQGVSHDPYFNTGADNTVVSTTAGKAKLTFTGNYGPTGTDTPSLKGSYGYKLELIYDGKTVYAGAIGATVQEPNVATGKLTYALLLNGKNASATVDETVTADSLDQKAVKVQVGKFYDGVLADYHNVSEASATMTNPDNKAVATKAAAEAGTMDLNNQTVQGTDTFNFYVRTTGTGVSGNNYNFTQCKAGTYTVSVKVPGATAGSLKEIKQYITVTNSQPAVVMSKRDAAETVDLSKIGSPSDATKGAILGAFQFSYDNNTLASVINNAVKSSGADGLKGELDITSVSAIDTSNATKISNNTITRFFVKKFDVRVPVVFGDANGDGTVNAADVVYITQTVNAGYYLQYK